MPTHQRQCKSGPEVPRPEGSSEYKNLPKGQRQRLRRRRCFREHHRQEVRQNCQQECPSMLPLTLRLQTWRYLLVFLPSSQRQVQARFRPSGSAFLLPVCRILSIFVISDLTLLLSYAAILPQLQIFGLLVLLWRSYLLPPGRRVQLERQGASCFCRDSRPAG